MPVFSVASPRHRRGALRVWCAANTARHETPSPARVDRVREKLEEDSACVIVGVENDEVIAVALAQPAREQNGAGAIQPGAGHVSMVFVAPDRWGRGLGGELLAALHREMPARGWLTSSLWTGAGNERARRLYEREVYGVTGDVEPHDGEEIVRYQLQLGEHATASCGP